MSECKYLKTEFNEPKTLGSDKIISKNNICQIKEDSIDNKKIKLILQKEIELCAFGGGSGIKWCLFRNLEDCPCNEN